MEFSKSVDVDVEIEIDVDEVFNEMDDDEKQEMFDLLKDELGDSDILSVFNEDYQNIFEHLKNRFNIQELKTKLQAAGLLPEVI